MFNDIFNHHEPLRQKQVRGNHSPFMPKDLSKEIMNKSKVKNKYLNWPSRENSISYKRTKNKSNSLTKQAKRDFFKEPIKDGIATNKKFWHTVKPFLTNNACVSNDFIDLESEANLICNEQELVELFNEHYVNIVEKFSGKKPLPLGNSSDASQDEMTFKGIFVYIVIILAFEKSEIYVILKIHLICHTQAQATSINKLNHQM